MLIHSFFEIIEQIHVYVVDFSNSTTNEISKMFLSVVHIIIRNGGNNGDIHRSLKYCIQNFKISVKNMLKYKISIFYKTNLKPERKARST